MTRPPTFDEHAKELKVRARPRPVTKVNRKVLIFLVAVGVLALFAAISLSLRPAVPAAQGGARNVYNVENTRKPDGLADLPLSYSDIQPVESRIRRLGPPLAGDLGATMLRAERELGAQPESQERAVGGFRPNSATEAERARRLKQAALAEEAARAPVFFAIEARTPSSSDSQELTYRSITGSELFALRAHSDRPIENTFESTPNTGELALRAGSIIPASLITGFDSDLPGTLSAQVTRNVFDSSTGEHVLIPQGARLVGQATEGTGFGQSRASITWSQIVLPDGSVIEVSETAADAGGYAGISGQTDHHWDRVSMAAGLSTLLGLGSEITADEDTRIERAVRRGVSGTLNQAGQRAVERELAIRPTIRVAPGSPVYVIVSRDLSLPPYNSGYIQ